MAAASPTAPDRPLVALTAGDPAGIGPEIVRAALADARVGRAVRCAALGPAVLAPEGVPLVAATDLPEVAREADAVWVDTGGPEAWRTGEPQAACGRAAHDALRLGAELATAGVVDALVTAPVSKEALHLAGHAVEGQTELLTRWAGVERTAMVAIAGELVVMLLTRHLPLADALRAVTADGVVAHLELFDEALRTIGVAAPRIALAGLNPHAGENGILGSEERERLEPAVRRARAAGLDVAGPLSPDTVFARAVAGEFDGVLALYHDQAFIPIKLLAPTSGLTLIAGLPYVRVSPTHGTAFDIAGQGRASAENLVAALLQAARWARRAGRAASPG